ncbi:hypothetical protein CapIbe_002429 [Capra ibex]
MRRDEETEVERKASDLSKITKGVEGVTEGSASMNRYSCGMKGFIALDAKAEAPILWPLEEKSQFIGKDPDAGKG